MFANQEKKAKLFLDAFDLIEAKVLDSEEETFYGIVSEKIRTMAMADKKKHRGISSSIRGLNLSKVR